MITQPTRTAFRGAARRTVRLEFRREEPASLSVEISQLGENPVHRDGATLGKGSQGVVPCGFIIVVSMLLPVHKQAPTRTTVRRLPDLEVWVLKTKRTTYVLGINELNQIQHLYWRKKTFVIRIFRPSIRARATGSSHRRRRPLRTIPAGVVCALGSLA